MKVLVFDTETTGLPKGKNPSIYKTELWPHIIQLSYIVYCSDENNLLTVEDDYIKISDDVIIEEGSQAIHKISREKLNKKGISIEESLQKFNSWSEKCDLLVGHNVSFDKRMVMVEGIRNKIRMNIQDTYCTMKQSTEICKIEREFPDGTKYFKYPSLSELYQHLFNHIPKNTHNALIDILICMRCFCKIELKKDISRINRTIRFMLREAH
jgi:DNA polymerase III epsilon subunit-like protein